MQSITHLISARRDSSHGGNFTLFALAVVIVRLTLLLIAVSSIYTDLSITRLAYGPASLALSLASYFWA